MRRSTEFRNAFTIAYDEVRASHSVLDWKRTWSSTPAWSHLMLYMKESVIERTANKLDLKISSGEPLRLDGVLSASSASHWFPMHVAIEHENDPRTLVNEIRSLLTIRAPLKVAITYCLADQRYELIVEKIVGMLRREFRSIADLNSENPEVEYLFLLGLEQPNNILELEWRVLTFNAAAGPDNAQFS